MEKYKIFITRNAYKQLREIRAYIENDLCAPQAAKDVISVLKKAVFSLEFMPARHPYADGEKWTDQGVRKLPVKNFIVFYSIDEEKKDVDILAVLSERRSFTEDLLSYKD